MNDISKSFLCFFFQPKTVTQSGLFQNSLISFRRRTISLNLNCSNMYWICKLILKKKCSEKNALYFLCRTVYRRLPDTHNWSDANTFHPVNTIPFASYIAHTSGEFNLLSQLSNYALQVEYRCYKSRTNSNRGGKKINQMSVCECVCVCSLCCGRIRNERVCSNQRMRKIAEFGKVKIIAKSVKVFLLKHRRKLNCFGTLMSDENDRNFSHWEKRASERACVREVEWEMFCTS